MKQYTLTNTLRLYVSKAQAKRALEELLKLASEHQALEEMMEEVILLSSRLEELEKAERMGMGRESEEKNRINLAVLRLIKLLEQHEELLGTEKKDKTKLNQRLDLLESKIDFMLHHIEKYDDLTFYGFKNSQLWFGLQPQARKFIEQANILEKEGKLDNYGQAIFLYMEAIRIDMEYRLFNKFKAQYLADQEGVLPSKKEVVDSFKGQNKGNFHQFLIKPEKVLSLAVMLEFVLANIFKVEKSKVDGIGLIFHQFFFSSYKVRSYSLTESFLVKYRSFNVKKHSESFVHSLSDVAEIKEEVLNFFLNLQPNFKPEDFS